MRKLSGNGIKVLKILHLLFAAMWLTGGLCITLLVTTIAPQESHEMYMLALILQKIDDWIIVPGALCCLATGIVYGVWTNWGFFKHRWITIKWIMTVSMILMGIFLMGPWVNDNVYSVSDISKYTMDNTVFFHNNHKTLVFGSIQVFLLIFIVILSVLKPWKAKK